MLVNTDKNVRYSKEVRSLIAGLEEEYFDVFADDLHITQLLRSAGPRFG